jgi:hypothetical protein
MLEQALQERRALKEIWVQRVRPVVEAGQQDPLVRRVRLEMTEALALQGQLAAE